ncbi:hypothetical protein ACFL26_00645 [Patescibacteria group bacterium]
MRVSIDDGNLKIEFSRTERLCSCRRAVDVPLEHIRHVSEGIPEPRLLEMRVPGTYIPGVLKAGTFWTRGGKEFWYVRRGQPEYMTIELREDAPFRRVVLSLDEGESVRIRELTRPRAGVTNTE